LHKVTFSQLKNKASVVLSVVFLLFILKMYNFAVNFRKMTNKRYLVTSALPYANGPLHIGHLAGAYISADIFVRYLRLMGKEVLYVCGSDEHGAAITMRAKKEGISPQEIIDKYDAQFRATFEKIGISFDIFHRTSAAIHHETSQEMFREMYRKGEFIAQTSEQYYDATAQQFLADRYIIGTCPKCANPNAYGDQCENCGSTLSPNELLAPIRSTLSDANPEKRETSHWFLPLDKYSDMLREYIEKGTIDGKKHHIPEEWKAHVLGQCKSWLDGGLEPRAMTRDLDWGIDVPQEIPGSMGKKLYVWFDAPIGYISATKQWALDNGKNWKDYWQNDETSLIHFVGKDNIVFHCLIFPAMLKAHGDFILPKNVPANQFLNLEGKKISTSRNWAVWVHEFIEEFPDKIDELRYNMIKNMPEQRDSEFTWKGYQETTNNELVNNIANFVNRVMVLTNKNYAGVLPVFDENIKFISGENADNQTIVSEELLKINKKVEDFCTYIEKYDFRGSLKTLMEISSFGNSLLQFNEPWAKQKTDPENVKAVLTVGIQIVALLSVACRPFMPFTATKLREMLNLPVLEDNGDLLLVINNLSKGELIVPVNHQINVAQHLFTRISDETIAAQIAKLEATAAENAVPERITYEPLKSTITFDDFQKIDLRVGVVTAAEKIKGAKKLLKLTVNMGFEERTIASGIAEQFEPEQVIGKEVVVVANLAPRDMRGVTSQGMILMAENEKGVLVFVTPSQAMGGGFVVK
jgi:methionyl-tRNA synthetase